MNAYPMIEQCAAIQQSDKNAEPPHPQEHHLIWYRPQPGQASYTATAWMSIKIDMD